jgi:neutral ceramidase
MPRSLIAGAASVDISPDTPQFLFGYPHVPRMSTGIHDPLLSSALFLSDGQTSLLLVANDVIFIGKESAARVRRRIEEITGIPAGNIMVTATHTHSGPITVDMVSNEADTTVPKADPRYLRLLEDGIVEAAVKAHHHARPASLGLAIADGSCVGTNRHDPAGPADPQVPVLVVRSEQQQACLAAMVVCSMHPTVLHEDSTLVSGDFPAMARHYLQEHVLGRHCPVIYHTGPCGDQSPRHVTRANTFDEARWLGDALGQSIARAINTIQYTSDVPLACSSSLANLPRRPLPPATTASELLDRATERLKVLRSSGAARGEIRTAECDLFGAEETMTLASAAVSGRLDAAAASVMPAEIMVMQIGRWAFVGWPGETYVEFALAVKAHHPDCCVISLANGELQGYLVTQEAVRQGRYEALNALFDSPGSGNRLVEETLKLLGSRVTPGLSG